MKLLAAALLLIPGAAQAQSYGSAEAARAVLEARKKPDGARVVTPAAKAKAAAMEAAARKYKKNHRATLAAKNHPALPPTPSKKAQPK